MLQHRPDSILRFTGLRWPFLQGVSVKITVLVLLNGLILLLSLFSSMSALFPLCPSSIQVRNFYSFLQNTLKHPHQVHIKADRPSCGLVWVELGQIFITKDYIWGSLKSPNSSESRGCGVVWEMFGEFSGGLLSGFIRCRCMTKKCCIHENIFSKHTIWYELVWS